MADWRLPAALVATFALAIGVERIYIGLDGRTIVRFRDRELAAPWYCQIFDGAGPEENVEDSGPWPGSIPVLVSMELHPNACDSRGFGGRVRVTLVDHVPLLTLLAGEPVVLHNTTRFGEDETIELTMEFRLVA